MSRPRSLAGLAILLVATAILGACVDADEDGSGAAGSGSEPEVVTVTLANPDEFGLFLSTASVPAGLVRFDVTNGGALLHEFALVRFDGAPGTLPLDGSTVDRGAVEVVAEVEDVNPGDSDSAEATLEPGTYVAYCNIPGHYIAGMWTVLTVE